MEDLLRVVSGGLIGLIALIWQIHGWWMRRAGRKAEAARRTRRSWHVTAQPGLTRSPGELAFLRAIRNSDARVRGPAVLASAWDLYCVVRHLPRGALESLLARQLEIPAHDLRLQRDDRIQLTLLYAVASAMRPEGFRLSVVGEAFVLLDDAVEVTIEPRGRLGISAQGASSPRYPVEGAWVWGPRSWPPRPFDRSLLAAGRRAARVPEATRRLVGSRDPHPRAPLECGLFVGPLAAGLDVKALERAALRRRCGSPELLRRCRPAQLALLLCCRARVVGLNADARQLPFEFDRVQAIATTDGVVRGGAWATDVLGAPSECDRDPEPGLGLRAGSALGSLVAAGAVQAVSGRPLLAAFAAVLWLALEIGRAYLGSHTSDHDWVAAAIPRLAGIAAGVAYAAIYMPGIMIAAIAVALGVRDADEIGYLAVLPFLGFVIGLLAQLSLRRFAARVRTARSAQQFVLTGSLLAAALAPTVLQIAVWIGLASVAASVGVLLKSEAAAEHNALRGTRGQPLKGMSAAFIATVGVLLVGPSLLPETARPVVLGLAPARTVFLALAALSLVGWRLLPKVLEVVPDTWQAEKPPPPLHSRALWRAVGLTALTVAAQVGPLNRLNELFAAHGSADPVRWTALLNLSIIVTAATMPWWDAVQRRSRWRAEIIAVIATVAAAAIGLLSLVLHARGFWWYTMVATSVVTMDVGVTWTWVCAEAEALTNAADIGRAALINAGRYMLLILAGSWAAVTGGSELNSVWLPAFIGSVAAALLAATGHNNRDGGRQAPRRGWSRLGLIACTRFEGRDDS